MTYAEAIEFAGRLMESSGVAIIVIGAVAATWRFLRDYQQQGATRKTLYRQYRTGIAMAILLGLEFLVAGDIVRTVVIEPNMQSVLVLAVIVLIRTFLSFELTLEIEGRWPWQRGGGADDLDGDGDAAGQPAGRGGN
ncbi:MAG: DUF1622 domain-containing protein [Chloroflexota bacterium]